MNFFSILTERETKSNTIKIYPEIEKYKLTHTICTICIYIYIYITHLKTLEKLYKVHIP